MDFEAHLAERRQEVERYLETCLPVDERTPASLLEGMRYTLLGGGKRLRPTLCLIAGVAVGGTAEEALPAAAAVEMIHTYSLIHDDLPCMDDDDFRRGRPTLHKVQTEAMAVLAGDALLTHAFGILAERIPDPARAARLVRELVEASGAAGMIGGQVMDLAAEGQSGSGALLEQIHRLKTAAMIRAAARMGAIAGGGGEEAIAALGEYGERLGLAFQAVDDILDVESSFENLGKTVGKDARQEKMSAPAVHGLSRARELAETHRNAACAAVAQLPGAEILGELARYVTERKS
ncbi:MAG: polyprenyl synthetase family protein [Planctomycetota bacterium]